MMGGVSELGARFWESWNGRWIQPWVVDLAPTPTEGSCVERELSGLRWVSVQIAKIVQKWNLSNVLASRDR